MLLLCTYRCPFLGGFASGIIVSLSLSVTCTYLTHARFCLHICLCCKLHTPLPHLYCELSSGISILAITLLQLYPPPSTRPPDVSARHLHWKYIKSSLDRYYAKTLYIQFTSPTNLMVSVYI